MTLPVAEGELLLSLVDPGRFGDFVEGRLEDVAGHDGSVLVVVEVEAFVEALVDESAGVVGGFAVELVGVARPVEALGEALGAEFKLAGGVGQLALDTCPLDADGVAALLNLGTAELAVGGEVDEPFLAGLQLGQLSAQPGVEFMSELLRFGHGFAEPLFQFAGEVLTDMQAVGVMAGDSFLDLGHRQVGEVAQAFLAGPTDVVAVILPVSAPDLGVDEPAGAALVMAALAEQYAFQVVGEDAVTLAPCGAGVHDLLHLVEEQLRHDRVVATGDEFAVHDDPAGIVRVGQHLVQLAVGDRLLTRPAGGGPGGEAEIGHGGGEPVDGVVAGGVQLEGLPHQRRALRVEADAVEQPAVLLGADVEVAELGAGNGAAVEGLVPELGLDVLAVSADLHFVEDVDDAFHSIGDVALTEVLFRGYQLDAELGELPLGESGVGEVAEGPRAHVDDHVVDLRMLAQVSQHLTEYRPLLNRLGRVAGFDEHLVHHRVQRRGAALAELSLGGDGVAVRVDVDRGVHLAGRGNAEVEDRVL